MLCCVAQEIQSRTCHDLCVHAIGSYEREKERCLLVFCWVTHHIELYV